MMWNKLQILRLVVNRSNVKNYKYIQSNLPWYVQTLEFQSNMSLKSATTKPMYAILQKPDQKQWQTIRGRNTGYMKTQALQQIYY